MSWRPRSAVQRFVVLFPGRTGSTFLMSALRGHPQVRATGELVGPLRTQGADVQMRAMRDFYRGPLVSKARAAGFKTKLVDVRDRDAFAGLIHDLDVRVLVLARENHVKHVVSRANAKRLKETTDRWNRRPGDDELPPISIPPDEFAAALSRVEAHQTDIEAWVAHLRVPTARFTYEALLASGQETFDAVCSFIGVDRAPLQGLTEKATNDDLRVALANFDEVRAHYAGSPYEAMFDEGAML